MLQFELISLIVVAKEQLEDCGKAFCIPDPCQQGSAGIESFPIAWGASA